jgi:hypothetical protein
MGIELLYAYGCCFEAWQLEACSLGFFLVSVKALGKSEAFFERAAMKMKRERKEKERRKRESQLTTNNNKQQAWA